MIKLSAISRFVLRAGGAGFALALSVLALALLLNPELPLVAADTLRLGLLFTVYFVFLWTVGTLALAGAGRLFSLLRRRPDRSARGRGSGWPATLGLCFFYLALAWGLNTANNRITVPPGHQLLLIAGIGLNLLFGAVLLGASFSWGKQGRRGGRPGVVPAVAGALLLLLFLLPAGRPEAGGASSATGASPPAVSNVPDQAPLPRPVDTGLRVLLVGLDSVSWDQLDPLLERGLLPNIARLVEQGSRGTLASFVPTESPLLWASLATGKLPWKHGVRFFLRSSFTGVSRDLKLLPRKVLLGRMESLGLLRFSAIDGRELEAAAFWDVTRGSRRTMVVNWWQTYPAPVVEGVMVSDHVAFVGLRHDSPADPGLTFPAGLSQEITRWEAERPLPEPAAAGNRFFLPGGLADPELESYIHWRCYEPDEKTARIAERLLAEEAPFELAAVYFNGLDPVGHNFWQYAHPEQFRRVDADRLERYRETLERYYCYTDELLGRLLAKQGGEMTVIVVSDHGMAAHRGLARFYSRYLMGNRQMTGGHRNGQPGIVILSGRGIRSGAELSRPSVLDITPTVLALLGYPRAADMDGRVLHEALDHDLWRRVTAIPQPASYDRLIVPGVHGDSPTAPGRDEEAYREHLETLGYLE